MGGTRGDLCICSEMGRKRNAREGSRERGRGVVRDVERGIGGSASCEAHHLDNAVCAGQCVHSPREEDAERVAMTKLPVPAPAPRPHLTN